MSDTDHIDNAPHYAAGTTMQLAPDALARAVFKAVDARDAVSFAAFFSPDGEFRFGNAPTCRGPDAIRDFVAGFFSVLHGLEHRLDDVHAQDGECGQRRLYIHLHVMYRTAAGDTEWLPALVVADDTPKGLQRYQIYSDPAPLHALLCA